MDINQSLIKIHICGKIDELIVESIFPELCNQKLNRLLIGNRQWKTEQFNWVAKIYKDNNFDLIYKEIQNDSDFNKIKKNVILSFGDEDNEKLFDKLLDIGIVYLPRFIFITKNGGNYKFKKKMFISNIIYTGLTDKEIISMIASELWEIDCYYNERGNTTCKYLVNNVLDKIEVSDVSINILLAGISRAGKSSFINIIAEKLLALENCEKSSITSKVSEYQLFSKSKKEKDGFIKIIDTPGFNYETKKNKGKGQLVDLEQINQGIFNLINDYRKKSSGEDIHFVLFFFLEGTPLQGTQKVLSSFMKENYKVLFIINKSINEDDNGETSDIKSTLKFLRDNELGRLAIRNNIIPCNLIDSKKTKGYGINTIFKRIFDLLIENNEFYNNKEIFKKIKDCNKQILEYLNVEGKEMEYKKYINESIKLKKQITEKNELFKKYEGEENILDEGKNHAESLKNIYIGLTASQAFIPIPYSDLYLTPTLQAHMIYRIFSGFGISITDIDMKIFGDFIVGASAREIGHLGTNYLSKQIFKQTAKGCLVQLAKIIATEQGSKAATESLKFIPVFGYLIGATIGGGLNYYFTKDLADKSIKFCEYYLRKKGCLEFIMNRIEIFSNIFKELERLSNKDNWWDYKVKLIKKADINNN